MNPFRKKDHDNEIFEKHIAIYYNDIFRYVCSIVKNTLAAQDITQTVMLKAFQKQHQLKDLSCSKSWLMQIAYHTSMDFLRLNKKEIFVFTTEDNANKIPDSTENILENLVKDLESKMLEVSLKQMDDKFQMLIMMRFDADLSIKEMSEILGIKEGTITSYICRGLKKLRLVYEEIERGELPNGAKLE